MTTQRPGRRLAQLVAIVAVAAGVAAAVLVPTLVLRGSRGGESLGPSSLPGAWERTVPGTAAVSGRWRMTLDAAGAVELVAPSSFAADDQAATYSVDGEQLRIAAFVSGVCAGRPFGVYRWTISGSTLRLESLSDSCAERTDVFDGAWSSAGDDGG